MRSLLLEHLRRDEEAAKTVVVGTLLRSGLLAGTILTIVVLATVLLLAE